MSWANEFQEFVVLFYGPFWGWELAIAVAGAVALAVISIALVGLRWFATMRRQPGP